MQKAIGVILAYNSGKTLENLFKRIPRQTLDDLILADDGSTDDTMAIAQQLGIKAFTHERRRYGGNLKFGIKKALGLGGDCIFEIHGDNQYDPVSILPALEKMKQGSDLVLGSRFVDPRQPLQDGMPLIKYLANRGLSLIDRWVLQLPISEFHTGFVGYSRRLLEKINFEAGADDHLLTFQFVTLAKYFGFSINEVPVRCVYHKDRLSMGFWESALYSCRTMGVLAKYLAAKAGFAGRLFKGK